MAHKKTTQELIAEEEKKAEQLKARMVELKLRQKAEERKRDNHRKIIAGAGVIAHIKLDAEFRKALRDALNQAVTDPKHRKVIADLLDEQAFQAAMRAAAQKAAQEAAEAKADQQPQPERKPAASETTPTQDQTKRPPAA